MRSPSEPAPADATTLQEKNLEANRFTSLSLSFKMGMMPARPNFCG